jgi:tetratricopeptide (TPR) repeat protein
LIKAVKIKPDYFYAIVALATTFEKSEDFENAIKYYEKAQELRDWDFGAHFGMGRTLYKKGDLDKAFEELITADTKYSRNFELHYILGKIYYEKEEYKKALNQFNMRNQLKKPRILKYWKMKK